MDTKTLGRFEIIREIGKGAMGVVYLAHDPKIDRRIAIKTIAIPPGVSEEEARETRHRFVREAQAAGKLTHPNIITVYDVVEEKDLSYIAMEYIEGETLESHTKPGNLLPLPRVLALMAQACAALDYAHKTQVIHRDIKPANLMLMRGDLLKITDFGLAKSPQANLTQAGVLIGTPNYMSPEQISGRPMDGRSDIFSLGVVLYELLTGERPFSGDTISTIIYRILYEEPRPPRIINGKLPPAFDGILKRALAKEPADRFQTGAEFIDAMNNYSTFHLKVKIAPGPPTLKVGKEEMGPRPVPLDRSAARLRRFPPAKVPFLAGQPFKIAAFTAILLAAVLIFPRSVHEVDRMDVRQPAAGKVPVSKQSEAGFGLPALATPPAAPPRLPENRAQVLAPSNTKLYLDNVEMSNPVVILPKDDSEEHTLQAVNGCRDANYLFKGQNLPRQFDMRKLEPKLAELQIVSIPPGAQVLMDDKLLGTTPVRVPNYNSCEPHTFQLRKENYVDFRKHFDETSTWKDISGTLSSVTLSEIPPGYARLESLPSYPLEVYEGKTPVPIKDGTLTLVEGKHNLTFKSSKVFFTLSRSVEITGSKTITLKQAWPGVGLLTVQAEPSNCKIYVDGEFLDYPPINGHEIAAGDHEITAVPDNDSSQTQKKQVTIEAGKSAEPLRFIFNP
jgi:serine/threonine protein kinase